MIIAFLINVILPLTFFRTYAQTRQILTGGLRVAVFDVDATPPVGSMLAYDPMINSWDLGLRAKGIVLLGAGQPIVLCAIDWIGIAGEAQDAFRTALAEAAGTIPERVAVHTLHQHDAPRCDFGAERLLKEAGIEPGYFSGTFPRELIRRLKDAIVISVEKSEPVTHIGSGNAPVHMVASNRRIQRPDGKIRASRSSSCKDPGLRAEPEGIIDPVVSLVSFWSSEKPLAVLSYYATHPQSYYRTGIANPDFPGIARFLRQLAVPAALHIHFNGAGGNVAAGKYNDGSHENRYILAERLADGMKRAWEATVKEPVSAANVSYIIEPVSLPVSKNLESMERVLTAGSNEYINSSIPSRDLMNNLYKILWLKRCRSGLKINVGCLTLGRARILYMPGELFVEYQLAAKAMRPDLFVAMAAYGDYGMGYIGTAEAYKQGGYETGIDASYVAPEVEEVLMNAIGKLLNNNK
jgi:hypothetical protein